MVEKRLQAFECKMKGVRPDLAIINEKLDDMPAKRWINTRLAAYFGILAAFIAILEFLGDGI